MPKIAPLIFSAFLFFIGPARAQKVEILDQGKPTSLRGLSVVDDKTAWVSGSKGYIAHTTDGGHTWQWQQVPGYEQADFRDIEAFSDKEAIVMSSGTPALILKTTDGGVTWKLKYKNDDKACFLDAVDFDDPKHGFALGDPINKKFLLLETTDAGESWHSFANMPAAMDGEAAFAASGTCLRVNKNDIGIVTGGSVARYLSATAPYKKWNAALLPIQQGKESQGAFSVNLPGFVFVGGDYANSKDTVKNASHLQIPLNPSAPYAAANIPSGYQSCVEYIGNGANLSTGTSGSNISTDSGRTWQQIDGESFNVCRKSKQGKLVLLAGDKGKIGLLKI